MKFNRASRLLKKSDFDAVFQCSRDESKGFILRRRDFSLYFRTTNQSARLGMSIPKKVVRQAAKRNRIKRCLREYFRLHQEEFSGDIVIRWHKAPKTMSYQNLALALEILRKHLRGI